MKVNIWLFMMIAMFICFIFNIIKHDIFAVCINIVALIASAINYIEE